MSGSVYSSLPRVNILGIKDNSVVAIPVSQESIPMYLPVLPLFTAWGPVDDALLTDGGAAKALYGNEIADEGSHLFNHQNLILQASSEAGGTVLLQRLESKGSKVARVRLALEIYEDEIPQYERNPDGGWKRDATGELIDTGDKLPGLTGRWLAMPIGEVAGEDDFGRGEPTEGTLSSPSSGKRSTVYPMFDVPARFLGAEGNNIGIRIYVPTLKSSNPVDGDLVEKYSALMYRLSVVKRRNAFTDPVVQTTIGGEQEVQFCLEQGVIDPVTEDSLYIEDVMEEAYELKDPAQRTRFSPIGEIHAYVDHIQTVQELIFKEEESFDTVDAANDPAKVVNLLTAKSIREVPYYTYRVLGPMDDGLAMVSTATTYLIEGDDGDISPEAYDEAVAGWLDSFATGNAVVPLHDSAKYPCSAFIDSGFSLETKKLIPNIYRRRDMWFAVATQTTGDKLNTPMQDSSIGASLRSHMRSVPESTMYGTPSARAVLMGNGGKLIGSKYRKFVPFTVLLASRCATYMGNAEGYMNDAFAFDSAPGSIITGFHSTNVITKLEEVANRDWENGLVQAQSFSPREFFWPGIKSIYPINNSILAALPNIWIACNLTRIGEQAWRNYTGNSKLTNGQLADRIEKFVDEQTVGKYDGRVNIIPRAYYTKLDTALGFSWHLDITMQGDNARTVEHLTILAERRTEGNE